MNKKSNWGYGIAAVYIIFALSAIGFVIFSRYHKMDLVARDYYQQELQYQDHIDRKARADSLADAFHWEYNASAGSVTVQFPGRTAADSVGGTILFFRPSDAAQDQIVPIMLSDQGRQVIDVSHLSKGMWRLKVFWNAMQNEYYNEDILVIG